MSGPAATAFRWKKYRFDVPGHAARQSGKHLPGKFVSLPDSLPSLPWGFEKRMSAKAGLSQSLTEPSVLSNRAAGGRTKLGMGTPRQVLPDVASVVVWGVETSIVGFHLFFRMRFSSSWLLGKKVHKEPYIYCDKRASCIFELAYYALTIFCPIEKVSFVRLCSDSVYCTWFTVLTKNVFYF